MSFLNKLTFWRRSGKRKTGVLRGILKCMLPCVKQRTRSSSPDNIRNTKEENNLENCKVTTHRCTGAQYEALIEAERHQEILEIRQMRLSASRRKAPQKSPDSAQLEENYADTEQDHQGKLYLGNYELIARLGRGGYGQVVLAKKRTTDGCTSSKDLVALKVVPKSRVSVVEKEVLIRAVGHPFLVQLLSYFETKVSACYVMEFMEGDTLESMLCELTRLSEEAARFYSSEIVLAVNFLHKRGIVHRDKKPGNVLLGRDGHCKLADFGLCGVGILNEKLMTSRKGTVPYAAPEIRHGHQYGCEADWWSVGLVMYNMMMGLYYRPVFVHPAQYPSFLSQEAVSILRRLRH